MCITLKLGNNKHKQNSGSMKIVWFLVIAYYLSCNFCSFIDNSMSYSVRNHIHKSSGDYLKICGKCVMIQVCSLHHAMVLISLHDYFAKLVSCLQSKAKDLNMFWLTTSGIIREKLCKLFFICVLNLQKQHSRH